jgi:hypothetical protein
MKIPSVIFATGSDENGSWNAVESRMKSHMPEGWQVKFHADEKFAPLLETMKKLERWFDTDTEIVDEMSEDERADHLRQLAMIRQAIKVAEE